MSHCKGVFWNKTNHTLNTAGLYGALKEQETLQLTGTLPTQGLLCGPEQQGPAAALTVLLEPLPNPQLVFHPRIVTF